MPGLVRADGVHALRPTPAIMAPGGHPNRSEGKMLALATPQEVLGHVGQDLGQS